MSSRLPLLASFDLDGTLVVGTSVSVYLAPPGTRGRLVASLSSAYARDDIPSDAFADGIGAAYRGLTRREIAEALEHVPVLRGIEPALGALRARGVHVVLATCTWKFAAEYFQARYGFDAVSGTEMEEIGGRFTGVVSRHFCPRDKVGFVAGYCARYGLPLDRCVAVGNASSDLDLFGALGRAIALNPASEAVRAAADVAIDTDDLRQVIPHLLHRSCASQPV